MDETQLQQEWAVDHGIRWSELTGRDEDDLAVVDEVLQRRNREDGHA